MALNYPIDTYITVEDAREYASIMELVLPETDEELELYLKRAAIYLDRLFGARYRGNRTIGSQVLYWPRTQLNYYDALGNYRSDFGTDSVPAELGQAQVELVALLYQGLDVFVQPDPMVKKEVVKLEGIETSVEYASASGFAPNPLYKIELLLAPLLSVGLAEGQSRRITMTRGA